METCKYGSGAGKRKPTAVKRKGVVYRAYKLLTARKSKRWIWWTRCLSRRKPKINSVIITREPWNYLENEITVILRNNNFEIYVLHLNKLRLVSFLTKYILRFMLCVLSLPTIKVNL